MILCFSGTGNSLYAARLISAAAGDEVVSLNALLRGGGPARFSSERPYVVVSPTHGWRLPAAVEALLRRGAWEGSRRMYFFLTCGSEPGDAAKYCRRLCTDLGMEYMGLAAAVMPENYLALFPTPDEAEAQEIVARARPGIEAAAREIAAGRPLRDPVHKGPRLPRHGGLHRLRQVRKALPRERHRHPGRAAALARTLHALYGLHKRLPGARHRIRPRLPRAAPLLP